jgi:hypothetical protein
VSAWGVILESREDRREGDEEWRNIKLEWEISQASMLLNENICNYKRWRNFSSN